MLIKPKPLFSLRVLEHGKTIKIWEQKLCGLSILCWCGVSSLLEWKEFNSLHPLPASDEICHQLSHHPEPFLCAPQNNNRIKKYKEGLHFYNFEVWFVFNIKILEQLKGIQWFWNKYPAGVMEVVWNWLRINGTASRSQAFKPLLFVLCHAHKS